MTMPYWYRRVFLPSAAIFGGKGKRSPSCGNVSDVIECKGFGDGGAYSRFDGRRGRRCEVTKLVTGTNDKGAEAARRQLHEVDGNHSPRALHAELLEESGSDDSVGSSEAIWVQ